MSMYDGTTMRRDCQKIRNCMQRTVLPMPGLGSVVWAEFITTFPHQKKLIICKGIIVPLNLYILMFQRCVPYGYSLDEIQIASDFIRKGNLTKARNPLQFLDSDWARMTM